MLHRLACVALVPIVALALPPVAEAGKGCRAGTVSVLGRFCVDQYEAQVDESNERGETRRHHSPFEPVDDMTVRARSRRGVIPQAYISQKQAAAACELAGKRLCTDDEWLTSCKGRTPTLYPYGTEHREGRCNERGQSPLNRLYGKKASLEAYGFEAMNDPRLNQMKDTLAKTGSFPKCKNAFGAFDMVGNLHEWTAASSGTFRGGYYLDTTENGEGCEYVTRAHATTYHDYSTGFRCCGDLGAEPTPKAAPRRRKAGK